MQLDKVVCPPGIFAPARTFSLVRDEHGVYLIYTGRAMGHRQGGGVAGLAANAILDSIEKKRAVEIEQNEAKLQQEGVAAVKDTKHSRFIPRTSIKRVSIQGGAWPVVILEADKRVKLHFHGHAPDAVRTFFEPFL